MDQVVGPYNIVKFTMAVDVVFRTGVSSELSGMAIRLFGLGGAFAGILFRKTNVAYLLRSIGAVQESTPIPPTPFVSGPWYRIVVVSDGPTMKMFVNGVLMYSKLDGAATGTYILNRLKVEVTANSPQTDYNIKNLRIWDVGLTDKQVSTL